MAASVPWAEASTMNSLTIHPWVLVLPLFLLRRYDTSQTSPNNVSSQQQRLGHLSNPEDLEAGILDPAIDAS